MNSWIGLCTSTYISATLSRTGSPGFGAPAFAL